MMSSEDREGVPITKAQDLRQLISLAVTLRGCAAGANRAEDIDLYLRAARMLEARAERLAYAAPCVVVRPQFPGLVDIRC